MLSATFWCQYLRQELTHTRLCLALIAVPLYSPVCGNQVLEAPVHYLLLCFNAKCSGLVPLCVSCHAFYSITVRVYILVTFRWISIDVWCSHGMLISCIMHIGSPTCSSWNGHTVLLGASMDWPTHWSALCESWRTTRIKLGFLQLWQPPGQLCWWRAIREKRSGIWIAKPAATLRLHG